MHVWVNSGDQLRAAPCNDMFIRVRIASMPNVSFRLSTRVTRIAPFLITDLDHPECRITLIHLIELSVSSIMLSKLCNDLVFVLLFSPQVQGSYKQGAIRYDVKSNG